MAAIIATAQNYWISTSALTITLNALGEANRVQASVASGAQIMCYIRGVDGLDFDEGHNYRRWPLTVSPTYFNTNTHKYLYVVIPRTTAIGTQAMVWFPSQLLDINGCAIDEEGEPAEQVGNPDYYYIWLQGIISSSGASGNTPRTWEQQPQTGTLATDEAVSPTGGFWYQWDAISQTVTFLKDIWMDAASTFRNLILGGKTLTGVAVDDTTPDDSTTHVATPAYVKAVSDDRYLHKDRDDTTPYSLTVEQELRVGNRGIMNHLQSTDYTGDGMLDSGYKLWYEEGRAKLVIDDLVARGKFTVNELETRIWTYAGGNMVFSGAGSTIFFVEYLDADDNPLGYTYINQPWLLRGRALLAASLSWSKRRQIQRQLNETERAAVVKFRCYEFSDDGTMQTRNWWKPNDIAMCQSLNKVRDKVNSDGSYSGALSNTVYKRRIAGIGSKEIPMLNDGRVYDYVDLWNVYDLAGNSCKYMGTDGQEHLITDQVKGFLNMAPSGATPSTDWPAAGDVIVQMGNPLDTDRQAAVTIEVQGDVHGFKVYDTISDYSMENKLWVEIGYDQTTSKAKANVYGDFRFGCRESEEAQGGSYVKYDRTSKVLDIKAKINARSTMPYNGSESPLQDIFDGKAVTYSTWGAWVVGESNNLHLRDLLIPTADITEGGVTYKAGKVYRCTQVTPSIVFTEVAYTDDTTFHNYVGLLLNKTWASGDDATAAAAQRAVLRAVKGDTVVDGGLLLTSLIAMRQFDGSPGQESDPTKYTTWGGISGIYDDWSGSTHAKGHGIAAWFGGAMVDKEDVQTLPASYAKSLFRMDGSGYVADGGLSWDYNNQGKTVVTLNGDVVKAANYYLNGNNITPQLDALFRMFELKNVAREGDPEYLMIHAKYGIYADGDVQALGYDPQQGGGGGGASVLYELNDVSPNVAHNAVLGIIIDDQNPQGDGYVLTYDYNTKHWIAAPAAETYRLPQATSQALGGIKIGYTPGTGETRNYAVVLDNDGKAYVNVPWSGGMQSDWDETDTASLAYIKNKPSIPSVSASANDSTLTVTINGTSYSLTDTDTWRTVQCDGSSIGSNTLNLKAGSNVSLSKSNGDITISSSYSDTWRPLGTGANDAAAGNHNHDGRYLKTDLVSIELNTDGSLSGYGGFIDFHFNGSQADYTSRIIEDASGNLNLNQAVFVNYGGNVGIGDTNPAYKLEVAGNCRISSKLMVATTSTSYELNVGGNIGCNYLYASSDVQVTSDERRKDVIGNVQLSVEQIAKMPSVLFRWKKGFGDDLIHVGTIAQSWEKVLPAAVGIGTDDDRTRSFSYSAAAYAMAHADALAICDLKKQKADACVIDALLRRISKLEAEIKQLKSA